LKEFNSDLGRRNFITIGAAAGFASAFGAPIGGVMFAMEEVATHFPHKMLWRTLMATAIACFTVFFTAELMGSDEDISSYGVLSFGTFVNDQMYPWELPLFVVLGAICGLVGALFNHNAEWFFHQRKRYVKERRMHVLEVIVISVITSIVTLILTQYGGRCMSIYTPAEYDPSTNITVQGTLRGWAQDKSLKESCPEGYFDDMSFLWLANREDALKAVIMDPSAFSWETMLYTFILFGACTSWTFGTSITSGIFMPTIMVGACLGGSVGLALQTVAPSSWQPHGRIGVGPWALMGAAGCLGGIQRTAISLCVIILEGTGQIRFLLPCILSVGMATYVGDRINQGIYHVVIHCKEVPFLEAAIKGHHGVMARDVMTSPVSCLDINVRVSEVLEILSTSKYHGFPVVSQGLNGAQVFEGIILRSQLEGLLVKRAFSGESQANLRNKRRNSVDEVILTTRAGEGISVKGEVFSALEQLNYIRLEDVMNRQPYTVHEETPFQRLYLLFVMHGLRQLPVLNRQGVISGIITRANIYRQAHGHADRVFENHAQLREEMPELYQQLLIDGALSDGVITREEWDEAVAKVMGRGGVLDPSDNESFQQLEANLPRVMQLRTPRSLVTSNKRHTTGYIEVHH